MPGRPAFESPSNVFERAHGSDIIRAELEMKLVGPHSASQSCTD